MYTNSIVEILPNNSLQKSGKTCYSKKVVDGSDVIDNFSEDFRVMQPWIAEYCHVFKGGVTIWTSANSGRCIDHLKQGKSCVKLETIPVI